MMTAQEMKLKRVLGFTTNGRNSFLVQPDTGNIIYIAGCIVVILNPQLRSQSHLITNSKQSIITLAMTEDGQYLAAANCGLKSFIYIWDLKTMTLLVEFIGHEFEVSSMCFSTNGHYLVSVGAQHDMMLSVWDWREQVRLVNLKVPAKIRAISFASDDSYFVTVGEACVKYWYLNCNNKTNNHSNGSGTDVDASILDSPSSLSISCQNATLGEQKTRSFCDVKCGKGAKSNSTFCITKDGLLCELNKRRLLHKWVDLRTSGANCLAISDDIIVIGCANGVARCFNTTEFRFLKNLPRPHTLGLDIAKLGQHKKQQHQVLNHGHSSLSYPNIIAIGFDRSSNTVSCAHNDRSLYSWDLNDPSGRVVKRYSALYHSSCIWGIDTYPATAINFLLPLGGFITCSSDDTLRIWNPNVFNSTEMSSKSSKRIINTKLGDDADEVGNLTHNTAAKFVYPDKNQFSDESCKIIFTDSAYKFLFDLDGGCGPNRADLNYDSNEGLRCLKISPSGKQLAFGNRSGAIRIFDFELDSEIKNIAAHDAEVLCLEYSDPRKFAGYCYLASSSRDKLIHIFDASNNYNFLQTIDDHMSSITALRFINSIARDCLQLVSCGADQRIIFRNGLKVESKDQLNFVTDQHIEGKTTFYDMEVDSESSCLITACQDRMLRLFNIAQVRYQSGFKGSASDEGTLIKIALDPSCTFLAASSTDKSISIYDYQRGECLASVVYGLSDLITDMKFSHDGRHLVACSGDGCIFIWESPAEIANAINGESGSSLAQLSLSPCSSSEPPPSGTTKQTVTDLVHPACDPLDGGDSLLNWSKKQTLDRETDGALGAPGRRQKSRYQVQNAALAGTLDSNLALATHENDEEGNYIMTNADEKSDNDDDYATLEEIRGSSNIRSGSGLIANATGTHLGMQEQQQQQEHHLVRRNHSSSSRSNSLDQMSRLAKAKLFQSRENLERITLREKFLNEGLAYGEPKQVRRGHHLQGDLSDKRVDCANSSLSGLFNTNSNAANTNNNKDNNVSSNLRLKPVGSSSSSSSARASDDDDELSSDMDQQMIGPTSQLPSRANRPITPPKPSLHRQIRRNSANQFAHPSSTSHPRSSSLAGAAAGNSPARAQRVVARTTASYGAHQQWPSQAANSSLGRGTKLGCGNRRLHGGSSLLTTTNTITGTGTGTGTSMRSSKSECDLDSVYSSLAVTDRASEEAAEIGRSIGQLNIGQTQIGVRMPVQQDDNDDNNNNNNNNSSIYCEKLNLSKLNPASVPLSQELCQYVVDELQALSKYATRLHQRLLANGNRGLSNMVSRGVQNSMDILSIVPSRGSHHHHNHEQRFQSQVNMSSVSMLSRRKQSHPIQQQQQQHPLRRPASSNSILGSLPMAASAAAAGCSTSETATTPAPFGGSSKVAATCTTLPAPRLSGPEHRDHPVDGYEDEHGRGSAERSADNQLDHNEHHYHHHHHHHGPQAASASGVGGNYSSNLGSDSSYGKQQTAGIGVNGQQAPTAQAATLPLKVSGSQQAKNNQLNLDQVLEAYSDRLFRMVQERMAAEVQQQQSTDRTNSTATTNTTITNATLQSCLAHKLLDNVRGNNNDKNNASNEDRMAEVQAAASEAARPSKCQPPDSMAS